MQEAVRTGTFTPAPHKFHPSILREYDIRGKVGETLSEQDAYSLGLAFGTKILRSGGSKVCVGYDGRHSSPDLAKALVEGLITTGVNVVNVGLGPTPMCYFAVRDKSCDGGIMVTGSHNPPQYNGFKITLHKSPVFGEGVLELGKISEKGDFEIAEIKGTVNEIDVKDAYVDRLLRDFKGNRPTKVAWDCGNGSTGAILKKIVSKLPGEHILLYENIDGDFPNHHPDPTVDKNLVDLQRTVVEKDCDLGIAFDGDGDRIGIIDGDGNIIRCDILMAVFARDVLAENKGCHIIGDIKCSQVMFDEIARLGGIPVMWKTGHSLIKTKMNETGALLAGELSGHIFFADKYYGFDDALYCAVRLLGILSENDTDLNSMLGHLPTLHNTPELRFEVEESEKFPMVEKLAEALKARANDDLQVSTTDGVRITTPDGWWLLRPSNTESVLVTRAESSSPEGLERLKKMVIEEVEDFGYDIAFPE
jgi:phosphomannomutase